MNNRILKCLNDQIKIEYDASNYYLSLAINFDSKGYKGISQFFYNQSTEERNHMIMVIKYIIEKGGEVEMPILKRFDVPNLIAIDAFTNSLNNEIDVTNSINESHHVALEIKDYTTANFLQWFINEQREEEDKFRSIIDKLNIIGDSGIGLYQIDQELIIPTNESI